MTVFAFVGVEKNQIEAARNGWDNEFGIALMNGYLIIQPCRLEVLMDKIDDFGVAFYGMQMPVGWETFGQTMCSVTSEGAYFKDLLGLHDATKHG